MRLCSVSRGKKKFSEHRYFFRKVALLCGLYMEFLLLLDKIKIWGVWVACWAVQLFGGLFSIFRDEFCMSCLSTSFLS